MKTPKFYSCLLITDHVENMVQAMEDAGLRVEAEWDAGTVEAFFKDESVFTAIQKGLNQPWIVRHLDNLFYTDETGIQD